MPHAPSSLSLFIDRLLRYVFSGGESTQTAHGNGDADCASKAISRSESDVSLGFSRSKSFLDLNFGELCSTGRLLSRLLATSLGLGLAGAIASRYYAGRRYR